MANTTIKGVAETIIALKKLSEKSYDGVAQGLRIWGEETMTIAKKDFVPTDLGPLKASGTVESKNVGGEPAVELSFGGNSPAGAYAIPVHERPARHATGGDKYLEKPVMQESGKLLSVVASVVKQKVGM